MTNKQDNQPEVEQETVTENIDNRIADAEPAMADDAEQTSSHEENAQTLAEALQKIESLEAEAGMARDQAVRAQAEAQNVRRRAEQDVEKAHKFGVEKFVNDLLPVVDNLERAVASIDKDNDALKSVTEGIELTLKSFNDTLQKHKVEAVDPEGEPFNPEFHQAMSMIENPDVEPNTVINVFQKGYTLHGRLVRPAMVVVAKAPASEKA